MSLLSMRVNSPHEFADNLAPEVLATVRRLDGGLMTNQRRSVDALVPMTANARVRTTLSVEPGRYLIEVRMPSGEVLSESVDVHAVPGEVVVLQSRRDDASWFGLPAANSTVRRATQTAIASTTPARKALAKKTAPAKKAAARRPTGSAIDVHRPRPASTAVDKPRYASDRVVLVNPDQIPFPALRTPSSVWMAATSAGTPWDSFVHDPIDFPPGRGSTRRPAVLSPQRKDAVGVFYEFTQGRMGAQAGRIRPEWLAVRHSMYTEIVSVPIPWNGVQDHRLTPVTVAVRRLPGAHGFAASVVVQDPQFAVLLGYLASGALPTAKAVLRAAHSFLHAKMDNPFAAAAGGYILVATADDDEGGDWEPWIFNLKERFAQLPDASILYATLRLRRRRDQREVQEGAMALKQAFRQGLPLYSLGLRWMFEGLERLAADDPEAAEMREPVRSALARLNPQSAFTILRVEGVAW